MLALTLFACFSRQILVVEDGPPGPGQTTVLTTFDVKNYLVWGVAKRVYWECDNGTTGLTCRQTCDIKDDQGDKLLCPKIMGAGL